LIVALLASNHLFLKGQFSCYRVKITAFSDSKGRPQQGRFASAFKEKLFGCNLDRFGGMLMTLHKIFFGCLFLSTSIGCAKIPCYPPGHYAPEPNAPYTAEDVLKTITEWLFKHLTME